MFKKKKEEEPLERVSDAAKGKMDGKVIGTVILIFLIFFLFGSSFYSLKENEYAVITTLGVPSVVEEPGIHFKTPLIQRCVRVP